MQSGKINTLRRHVKYKSERTRGKYWNPRDQEFETNLKLLLLPPNTARTYPSSDLKSDWKRARSGRYLILVSRSSSRAHSFFARDENDKKREANHARGTILYTAHSPIGGSYTRARARSSAFGDSIIFLPRTRAKGGWDFKRTSGNRIRGTVVGEKEEEREKERGGGMRSGRKKARAREIDWLPFIRGGELEWR